MNMAAYGCPHSVAAALQKDNAVLLNESPLLLAVKKLGPMRCQWAGGVKKQAKGCSVPNTPTSWLLDGDTVDVKRLVDVACVPRFLDRRGAG